MGNIFIGFAKVGRNQLKLTIMHVHHMHLCGFLKYIGIEKLHMFIVKCFEQVDFD